MPNYFKPTDVYPIMNSLVHQITGQDSLTVTDTTSFVDAGKSIIGVANEGGYENVFNAISVLIGKTIVEARPYKGNFDLIAKDSSSYDARVRKISFYSKDTQASGMFNTQLYTNLAAGLDDTSGAGSQWEQNPQMPLERTFFSLATYDYEVTEYIEQIRLAFTSEDSFLSFLNGMRVEIMNDMEQQTEARNRALVLSRFAGNKLLVDKGELGAECAVNLTAEFNKEYGTSYTTHDLLYDHRVTFLEFFLARLKNDSDMMKNRTTLFHDDFKKTVGGVDYVILRHTPKASQKFIYNSRLFTQIKLSLAEIFHPEKLALPPENGEGIQYWQSATDPYAIDIVPALPEGAPSSEVKIDYVVGMLFDDWALYANNRYDSALPTPINARHGFRNTFYHFLFSMNNDYSHPSVLYYMSDETTEYFVGDGTEDDFQLKVTPNTVVSVTVNGVAQTSGTDYIVSTDTVTFTTAPAKDAIIQIIYK